MVTLLTKYMKQALYMLCLQAMRKCVVCSPDLRLHICIGPELEFVNPHEATVAVEKSE
jgi:hypothetical protein